MENKQDVKKAGAEGENKEEVKEPSAVENKDRKQSTGKVNINKPKGRKSFSKPEPKSSDSIKDARFMLKSRKESLTKKDLPKKKEEPVNKDIKPDTKESVKKEAPKQAEKVVEKKEAVKQGAKEALKTETKETSKQIEKGIEKKDLPSENKEQCKTEPPKQPAKAIEKKELAKKDEKKTPLEEKKAPSKEVPTVLTDGTKKESSPSKPAKKDEEPKVEAKTVPMVVEEESTFTISASVDTVDLDDISGELEANIIMAEGIASPPATDIDVSAALVLSFSAETSEEVRAATPQRVATPVQEEVAKAGPPAQAVAHVQDNVEPQIESIQAKPDTSGKANAGTPQIPSTRVKIKEGTPQRPSTPVKTKEGTPQRPSSPLKAKEGTPPSPSTPLKGKEGTPQRPSTPVRAKEERPSTPVKPNTAAQDKSVEVKQDTQESVSSVDNKESIEVKPSITIEETPVVATPEHTPAVEKPKEYRESDPIFIPAPDDFYNTLFYFSGMGCVIGDAMASGVYVNKNTSKRGLDIDFIEAEDHKRRRSTSRGRDLVDSARVQATDLTQELKKLQHLLESLPTFGEGAATAPSSVSRQQPQAAVMVDGEIPQDSAIPGEIQNHQAMIIVEEPVAEDFFITAQKAAMEDLEAAEGEKYQATSAIMQKEAAAQYKHMQAQLAAEAAARVHGKQVVENDIQQEISHDVHAMPAPATPYLDGRASPRPGTASPLLIAQSAVKSTSMHQLERLKSEEGARQSPVPWERRGQSPGGRPPGGTQSPGLQRTQSPARAQMRTQSPVRIDNRIPSPPLSQRASGVRTPNIGVFNPDLYRGVDGRGSPLPVGDSTRPYGVHTANVQIESRPWQERFGHAGVTDAQRTRPFQGHAPVNDHDVKSWQGSRARAAEVHSSAFTPTAPSTQYVAGPAVATNYQLDPDIVSYTPFLTSKRTHKGDRHILFEKSEDSYLRHDPQNMPKQLPRPTPRHVPSPSQYQFTPVSKPAYQPSYSPTQPFNPKQPYVQPSFMGSQTALPYSDL